MKEQGAMSPLKIPYTRTFEVKESDLDSLNHVNNIRYLEWVQDVSRDHWMAAIQGRIPLDKYTWVVVSHHISYKRPALLGDCIQLITYIEDFGTATSKRMVDIRNMHSNALYAHAETVWCLYDQIRKKATAIPDEVRNLAR